MSGSRVKNSLQYRAFRSIYRCHPEMEATERFVFAICKTSDDALAEARIERPRAITRWFEKHRKKGA